MTEDRRDTPCEDGKPISREGLAHLIGLLAFRGRRITGSASVFMGSLDPERLDNPVVGDMVFEADWLDDGRPRPAYSQRVGRLIAITERKTVVDKRNKRRKRVTWDAVIRDIDGKARQLRDATLIVIPQDLDDLYPEQEAPRKRRQR